MGQGPTRILGWVHAWGVGTMGDNGEYMVAGQGGLGLLCDAGLGGFTSTLSLLPLLAACVGHNRWCGLLGGTSPVQGRSAHGGQREFGAFTTKGGWGQGIWRWSWPVLTTSMAVLSFKSPVQAAVRAGGIPGPRGGVE
jgi:hypothetical protein